jgi:hypothetical protein
MMLSKHANCCTCFLTLDSPKSACIIAMIFIMTLFWAVRMMLILLMLLKKKNDGDDEGVLPSSCWM